jgi:phosphoribosylformylglycinamidine (FGAM) synthase PurS component
MRMNASLRVEVASRRGFQDGRARRLLPLLRREDPRVRDVRIIDIYIVHDAPGLHLEDVREVFSDPIAQEAYSSPLERNHDGWDCVVEIAAKPGVTDPVAATALQALRAVLPTLVPAHSRVQTATQYQLWMDQLQGNSDLPALSLFFFNPLIQSA